MQSLTNVKLKLVESLEDANELMRWLGERREVLAIDTETTGLEWHTDKIRLAQLGDADTGWAMRWDEWSGVFKQALRQYEGPIVGQNVHFDLRILKHNGFEVPIPPHRVHDTRIMAHLYDSSKPTGLKPTAARLIDPSAVAAQAALDDGMEQNGWDWATVPFEYTPYWLYSAMDTVLTARLYREFANIRTGQLREMYELERAVGWTLSDMEQRGLPVDLMYTRQLAFDLASREEELGQQIRAQWPRFWSAKEDRLVIGNQALVEELTAAGAPLSKLTETGNLSVDKEVLEGLSENYELARLVHEVRQAHKIRVSYVDTILSTTVDDRVYPHINPIGARTGRMSVSNPPFQQLPSRSPLVRDCVVAPEGQRLISVDYDQIELRVLAHIANEKSMVDAIFAGEDLHQSNAVRLYGPNAGKKERKMAKGGAFAKVYGAGPGKLAAQQGIPLEQAEAFMRAFDETFTGVSTTSEAMMQAVRARQAQGRGYIKTFFGRRTPTDRGKEYTALNYYCQGTAADILKRQLVEIDRAGLTQYALLPVHDEVIFSVPAGEADDLLHELSEVMTDSETFRVPISASGEVVTRWGDAYDLCVEGRHEDCNRRFCSCSCKTE